MSTINIKNTVYETSKGKVVISWTERNKLHYNQDFMSNDIFDLLSLVDQTVDSFILIVNGHSESIESAAYEEAIRSFINEHSDRFITARIGFGTTIPEFEQFVKYVTVLEKIGFRDINLYCHFEHSIPFVYRNYVSDPFLDAFTRFSLRTSNVVEGYDNLPLIDLVSEYKENN